MKKLLSLVAALCLTTSAIFAERIFEFGIDVLAQGNENFMPLEDIFVEDLVIDLPAIADSMGDEGFVLDALFEPSLYTNFYIGGYGVGASLSLDGYMKAGIGKDFWDFLAYGNNVEDSIEVPVSAGAEFYVELAVPVNFKIGKFQIKVAPAAFMPVAYVPNPNAKIVVSTNSDGSMTADGSATYTVYTATDISNIFDKNWQLKSGASYSDLTKNLSADIWQTVGLDIDAEVEYPLLSFLTLGGYTHIPVIPGRLNYSATQTFTANATLNPVLDSLQSGSSVSYDYTYEFGELTFGNEIYSVNRPFRLGVTACVKVPFVGNLTVLPKIGFATRNPFGEDYNFSENSMLEYSLGVHYSLLNMLNFSLTHEFSNQIFSNYAGFALNIRILQLNLMVGTSGPTFAESFSVEGLKAKVGICVGF